MVGAHGGSHPDPGKHRTLFYGHYANRARGGRAQGKPAPEADNEAEVPKKRRCRASWARLISKEYQVDPLRCRGCGGQLQIVAYINDSFTIKRTRSAATPLPEARRRLPCR